MLKGKYYKLPKTNDVYIAYIVSIDDSNNRKVVSGCGGLIGEHSVYEYFNENGIDVLNIELIHPDA
jgi:hypothetical protein